MTTPGAPLIPPATGPSVWQSNAWRDPSDWVYELSPMERDEIVASARAIAARDVMSLQRDEFPLPTLGAKLIAVRNEVLNGRGFALVRGFPVERLGQSVSVARAFWGLGTWLGDAVSQNKDGCLLGHVRDTGASAHHPQQRGFQSRDALPYHTDVGGDVIALLCLQTAKQGGQSTLASAGAIHNALLTEDPALVDALSQPIAWDRRGEIPPGARPWYLLPVFARCEGRLLTSFVRRFLEGAQKFPDAPRITTTLRRAIARMAELAHQPEFHLAMDFRPGDIQLVNNHAILHSRTEYQDRNNPNARRHLLRLWLALGDGWALTPSHFERYPARSRDGRPGGISAAHTELHVPLSPNGG